MANRKAPILPDGSIRHNGIVIAASEIDSMARYLSAASGPGRADDMRQELYLSLWDKPLSMSADTRGKIKARLNWSGCNARRREQRWPRGKTNDAVDFDDVAETVADTFDLEGLIIEAEARQELAQAVETLMDSLSTFDRAVARLLMRGYRQHEIADRLKVTRGCISHRIRQIRAKANRAELASAY